VVGSFLFFTLFSWQAVFALEGQELAKNVISQIDAWGVLPPQALEFASDCESRYLGHGQHGLDYDPKSHLINTLGLKNYPSEYHAIFLAHEYGHAVFRANIKRVALALDDHMELSLEFRRRLRAELSAVGHCDTLQPAVSPEFVEFEKGFLDLDYFTFAALKLGAYDELLADIFAVLYDGRGNAMYLALGGDSVDWGKKYFIPLPANYRGRDFTYVVTIEQASDEKRKIIFYDFLGAISDLYNVLDPTRSYLWNNYLRTLPRSQYGNFINAYLLAVGEEYRFYVENGVWEQPVREMNTRFIDNLEKHLTFLRNLNETGK
jgi:hypothetical protein